MVMATAEAADGAVQRRRPTRKRDSGGDLPGNATAAAGVSVRGWRPTRQPPLGSNDRLGETIQAAGRRAACGGCAAAVRRPVDGAGGERIQAAGGGLRATAVRRPVD